MALILNIETANKVCSVSLAKDGQLMAFKEHNGDYSHAENLTLFIEDVLLQAGVKLQIVDAIAVSMGPGSYTGLRIGVSAAKGLCYALDKPLIAISTLKHLAFSISNNLITTIDNDKLQFCPMLDARRMEVYCAIFDFSNNEIKPTAAEIMDENSFSGFLNEKISYFFGDGAAKCKELLSVHENMIFIDNVFPSAINMIALSEQAYINKQFEDIAYFEPFYLKDFIAGKKKSLL